MRLPSTLPPTFSFLPLPPPIPLPGVPRRIATPMPAILNLKFKVGRFFPHHYMRYLTLLPGQQIFRSIQQLERCRFFNQDLEGTQLTRSKVPSFPAAHPRFRLRFVPRSLASSSKGRGSRTLAGGYGTSKILWLIPTTPVPNESSSGSPSTWATNSTKRRAGM